MRKLASLAILYVALSAVFVLLLLVISYKEPGIVASIATDEPTPFLTYAEAAHMHDVHVLVNNAMLAAVVIAILLFFYNSWNPITRSLVKESLIMDFVLVALLIPFNYTFTWFHEAFFPGGNWQFPADSWLITHFPPSFFAITAVTWILGTAILLTLILRQL